MNNSITIELTEEQQEALAITGMNFEAALKDWCQQKLADIVFQAKMKVVAKSPLSPQALKAKLES